MEVVRSISNIKLYARIILSFVYMYMYILQVLIHIHWIKPCMQWVVSSIFLWIAWLKSEIVHHYIHGCIIADWYDCCSSLVVLLIRKSLSVNWIKCLYSHALTSTCTHVFVGEFKEITHVWQSQVESEHYSYQCLTIFFTLYCYISMN